MQTYQSTPDYYRDYIEHGWLKDQAAKTHKYIERWRGKNGKWVYRYKSKAQELNTKIRRRMEGISDPEAITVNGTNRGAITTGRRNWSGRPNSRLDSKAGSRVNQGIAAGRKRAKRLGVKGTYRKGESLSERGYSSSTGSATSYGNYHTRRNWKQDTDAQNWADVWSGRKTFDEYKDSSKSAKSKRDVHAGTYAGRKRRRKKK